VTSTDGVSRNNTCYKNVTIRTCKKKARKWDPETGKCSELPYYHHMMVKSVNNFFFWSCFHPQAHNQRMSHLCALIEPQLMSMTTSLRRWRIISRHCDAEVGTAVPGGLSLFCVGRGRRMTHPAGVLTDRPLPCRRRLFPVPCNDA